MVAGRAGCWCHFNNMSKVKTPVLILAKVWLKQKLRALRFLSIIEGFCWCSCYGKPSWGFTLLAGIRTLMWKQSIRAILAEMLSPSQINHTCTKVFIGRTMLIKDNVGFFVFLNNVAAWAKSFDNTWPYYSP